MLMRKLTITHKTDQNDPSAVDRQHLLELIRRRAENLFASGQMMCSEAVMATLNQGLGGGLPPELAFKLASAQSNGMGGRGCTCGALNGGILALGLFFGRERPGFSNGKYVRDLAGELHDLFKARFGATCCRILTRHLKADTRHQYRHCCHMTAVGAELAAQIILSERPELTSGVDWVYLEKQVSSTRVGLRKLHNMLRR